MKKTTIEIPIFKGTLEIIYDKDLKYVENTYKTKSLDGYGAVTLKDESQYRHYIIAFEYLDQGIMAHEVVHLVNYIFLDCGIELDRCNDETQAYLTAWLHEQIDKALKVEYLDFYHYDSFDDFAIGFGEWLINIYNEDVIFEDHDTKELLEIYKGIITNRRNK